MTSRVGVEISHPCGLIFNLGPGTKVKMESETDSRKSRISGGWVFSDDSQS